MDLKSKVITTWTSIKATFAGAAENMRESSKTRMENQFSQETSEEIKELKSDVEARPYDQHEKDNMEDPFGNEVKVEFGRDDDNYPAHELRDLEKDDSKPTKPGLYGTM